MFFCFLGVRLRIIHPWARGGRVSFPFLEQTSYETMCFFLHRREAIERTRMHDSCCVGGGERREEQSGMARPGSILLHAPRMAKRFFNIKPISRKFVISKRERASRKKESREKIKMEWFIFRRREDTARPKPNSTRRHGRSPPPPPTHTPLPRRRVDCGELSPSPATSSPQPDPSALPPPAN